MQTISPITEQLIDLALTEDLACGDFTTDAIFTEKNNATGYLIAKEDLVICGIGIFEYVIRKIEDRTLGFFQPVTIDFLVEDGEKVTKGTKIAEFSGSTIVLLKAERTALNLLQHMSGVATQTRKIVEVLGPNINLTNTRKTLPGMRELQHYAVRCGGGHSHRFNLGGGVMIKDNHIAAAGGIEAAVKKCRDYAPHTLKIEVEVTNQQEVAEALKAGADIIMLDNMSHDEMIEACKMIGDRAIVEISGNVTLEKVEQIRDIPVYCASCGALTHSAHGADISMRMENMPR